MGAMEAGLPSPGAPGPTFQDDTHYSADLAPSSPIKHSPLVAFQQGIEMAEISILRNIPLGPVETLWFVVGGEEEASLPFAASGP